MRRNRTMTERILKGIAAAEGIAIGPAFCYQPPELTIPRCDPLTPDEEMARFDAACRQAAGELAVLKERVEARANAETAAIFEAHAMILDDPTLRDAVKRRIDANLLAEEAVKEATEEIAAIFSAMENELFAARAADVLDLGRRLLRILLDVQDTSLDALTKPSIVVAYDLTPSDTASLEPEMTLGFCTAAGGLTSHTAILARTLGIPAVVGLGSESFRQIADGASLALDGSTGEVVVDPSEERLKRYEASQAQFLEQQAVMQAGAKAETRTADGKRVEVGANVGDLASARKAVENGAEGIGLLRTEFLYLQNTRPPAEENQVQVYRAIFEALEGRPVIVRTLDIGGDKPPSYLEFDEELNPFLGWRAIRICLDDLPLFKTQLRAILRAAVGHNPLIMFPMISSVEELRRANDVLAECRAELEAEGLEHAPDVPTGIMVETPAAAVLADILAAECDFFSLGTNDLTQYTLAVDRTNERVAHLFQPLHPAVLRLIKQTIDASHAHDRWTGMCGELAGMLEAIPILLGMGLDEFSMVPSAIPRAKWLIGQLTTERAAAIAEHALSLPTAAEVHAYMRQVLDELGA